MALSVSAGLARLEENGIYFDDLNRIRTLDEESRNQV